MSSGRDIRLLIHGYLTPSPYVFNSDNWEGYKNTLFGSSLVFTHPIVNRFKSQCVVKEQLPLVINFSFSLVPLLFLGEIFEHCSMVIYRLISYTLG